MASVATEEPTRSASTMPKMRPTDYLNKITWGVVGGHIGAFTAIALYFLFTQTNGYIHALWNTLFPFVWIVLHGLFTGHPVWPNPQTLGQWGWWTEGRHVVARDALEGIIGGFLVKMALFNGLKKNPAKTVDRLLIKLKFPSIHQGYRSTPWQIVLSPFTAVLASLPGLVVATTAYFGGIALSHHLHFDPHLVFTSAHGTDIWAQVQNVWRNGLPGKLIGLTGLLFFGRKVFNKVGYDLQEMFAEKRVARMRAANTRLTMWAAKPSRFLPANFKYLVKYISENVGMLPKHGRAMTVILYLTIPVITALTIYGYSLHVA